MKLNDFMMNMMLNTGCNRKVYLTFLAWSLSSICPKSLPLACAILFPETKFPTITEAGPISRIKQKYTKCNKNLLLVDENSCDFFCITLCFPHCPPKNQNLSTSLLT